MLLENFRSVRIILGEESNEFVKNEIIPDIVKWLNSFDEWYRKETGINNSHNLHFLYHRELFISGHRLLANISALEYLLSSSSQLSLLLCLRVYLEECYEFFSELEMLTEQFKPSYMIIDAGEISYQKYPPNFVISLIEGLALKKIHLSFIGPVSFWLDSGISRSQIVGETIYDIMPHFKKFKRHFWGEYNPCAKRFMFVINSDGLIYPCMGLVGIESCSIGTIQQPLPVVWETMKHHSLNLEKLAPQGPKLELINVASEELNFGSFCEAHRYEILSKENKDAVPEKI